MTFDWSQYRGNLKWLPERTLYLTVHGSRCYGTSLPTSDIDIRGIAVAPMEYYLGVSKTFEQAVQNEPIDLTIFDIRKFFKLAMDANPNALEILFTDPSDHLHTHWLMRKLFEARNMFLSRKTLHTFSGYSKSQLRRIQGHYRWLSNPPKAPPTRAEFGLPERTVIPADQLAAAQAAIKKQVDSWSWQDLENLDPSTRLMIQQEFERRLVEITQWHWSDQEARVWNSAARTIGLDENFIRLLDIERQYTARLKEWQQYQDWKKNRNPARAELEEKYGYDAKHAMHLVRLLRMCKELLTEGVVRVKRPDAEELLSIRAGAWTYEQLIEYSDKEDAYLHEIVKNSPLPNQPDREGLDTLCAEIIQEMA
jgi:uncharacterized protein